MNLWFTCVVTHWFTPPQSCHLHRSGIFSYKRSCFEKALLELLPSLNYKLKGILNNKSCLVFFSGRETQALKLILMLKITRLHIIPAVTWQGFSACSEGKRKERVKRKQNSTSPKSQIFKMLNNLNSERIFQAKAVRLWFYKADCSIPVAKQNGLYLSFHNNIAVKL